MNQENRSLKKFGQHRDKILEKYKTDIEISGVKDVCLPNENTLKNKDASIEELKYKKLRLVVYYL